MALSCQQSHLSQSHQLNVFTKFAHISWFKEQWIMSIIQGEKVSIIWGRPLHKYWVNIMWEMCLGCLGLSEMSCTLSAHPFNTTKNLGHLWLCYHSVRELRHQWVTRAIWTKWLFLDMPFPKLLRLTSLIWYFYGDYEKCPSSFAWHLLKR